MIRYTLKCSQDHRFDVWFRGSDDCDDQIARGLVSCAVCGTHDVEKALMAPATRTAETRLDTPATKLEAAMTELRRRVTAEADYVGDTFAAEARAIHDGESDERRIWGEATKDEARALIEDGITIAPLPPFSRRDD